MSYSIHAHIKPKDSSNLRKLLRTLSQNGFTIYLKDKYILTRKKILEDYVVEKEGLLSVDSRFYEFECSYNADKLPPQKVFHALEETPEVESYEITKKKKW